MSSSFDLITLIPIIVTALVAILKIRKAHEGSKVNRTVLIAISIVFSIFVSYFILNSFLIGIPVLFLPVFIIIFIGVEFLTCHYVKISFWRGSDGSIYSKGGLYIQIVFITSLVLRISVSIIFLGSASFYRHVEEYAQLVNDTPIILIAILVTNISLIISGGIVIGLNRRLLREYNLFNKRIEPTK
jgi:hypothetical protein